MSSNQQTQVIPASSIYNRGANKHQTLLQKLQQQINQAANNAQDIVMQILLLRSCGFAI